MAQRDYRLLNARNRIASLEYERDHPDEFDHKHPPGGLEKHLERARAALAALEHGGLERAHQTAVARGRLGWAAKQARKGGVGASTWDVWGKGCIPPLSAEGERPRLGVVEETGPVG